MPRTATKEERDTIISAATNLIGEGVARIKVIEMLFTAAASLAVPAVDDSPCTDGRGLCRSCFIESAEDVYDKVTMLDARRTERAH